MTGWKAWPFREVWAVDFEYAAPDGECPTVACMVARELHTGHTLRLWQDELATLIAAPFSTGAEALFVAYYASAEMNCFLTLRWAFPVYVLDLYVEFSNLTNGLPRPSGRGLVGALTWFGLPSIDAAEKDSMRKLAQQGHWSDEEKCALLEYCESDVVALERLINAMYP